ncbi:hypothetical protein [Paraflavitalea pollutisoli]|uniref:hypothetical protein n=1 Tax=Paraflavitalea pollutisoli TaxID=3034143 RepID=UPI0023ED49D0|nr:hypothetical protein [Paraflavitalea sp. H1-2-19X]
MKLTTFALLLISTCTFAQSSNIRNLLDTALTENKSLFVYASPITTIQLDKTDINHYTYLLSEYTDLPFDTLSFLEIIQNVSQLDTSKWTDDELPRHLLVNNRQETIQKSYVLRKFNTIDEQKVQHYLERVAQFNTTAPEARRISYFSRPLFNNAKTVALIRWGYTGGGCVVLYQRQANQTWLELGPIQLWAY